MAHFIFNKDKLKQNISYLHSIFREKHILFDIFYSVKTNSSEEVLNTVIESGAQFEIVSELEWSKVKALSPKVLVLNGPSKSKELVEDIIKAGVEKLFFNVDNDTDLEILRSLNQIVREKVKIGVRVYLNREGVYSGPLCLDSKSG
jgi:diaminopimelate decarboxylase